MTSLPPGAPTHWRVEALILRPVATPAREAEALDDLLCSRCTRREAGPSGFCEPCTGEHLVEANNERDADEIARRRYAWRSRSVGNGGTPSATRVAACARQRRHRVLSEVRPKEPVPPGADPLELGREALMCLRQLRSVYTRNGRTALLAELERAEELVRWLAWGPVPLR